jgi:hypothetical protein
MTEAWESIDGFRSKREKGRALSNEQIEPIVLFHTALRSAFVQKNADYESRGERPRTLEEFLDEQIISHAQSLSNQPGSSSK